MSCEWGRADCRNEDKRCDECFSRDFHYAPAIMRKPKQMAQRQARPDKRMGSSFEYNNHLKNEALLSGASTRMTPNSGAGHIKGDEEITGIIEIMEELKTKIVEQAPGKESFTIKKEWLTKLQREAMAANKEFWYLKFSFNEHAPETYIIVEDDVIMSMVKTMVEDRKSITKEELKAKTANALYLKENAKVHALQAEVDYLKQKLEEYEFLEEIQ